MSETKSSAATRTQQATGNRGRFLRGVALADRKASEYGWADRPSRVGEGKYRVPSCTREGVRYKVDVSAGKCECSDHNIGNPACKHLICAMILESRRRSRMSRIVSCDGCPARIPYGETREVTDEHVEGGSAFFAGDLVCGECARRAGIS